MKKEKKGVLVSANAGGTVKTIVFLLGFTQLFLLSCNDDNNTTLEVKSYPSNIISTPIHTTNIPASVAESQSPINIEPLNTVSFHSSDPTIHYGAVTLNSLQNTGENLKINVTNADNFNNYITVGGKKYNLVNFHFHYNSEHTINGNYSTMEIHFVNVSADNSYAVLSVLTDLGTENSSLQNLFSQSPTSSNSVNSPNTTFDLSSILPNDTREYYTYSGSLTTPNFGANSAITNGGPVTWFVFKNKQQLSTSNLNTYKSIYTEPNFRTIQPLNGRTVYVNQGY